MPYRSPWCQNWTRLCGLLLTLLLASAVGAPALAQETARATVQDLDASARDEAAARAAADEGQGRLRLFLEDAALSPTLSARLAFSAALDQRGGEPAEWGGGAEGLGRRVAGRAALNVAQAGVHHATATWLRVDPRGDRERCACGHPLRRTANALARTFVTRDARGRRVPNVPLFAGAYGGALLATTWYPPSYRADREAVRVAGLTIVAQAGANVVREFAPELKRLLPGGARRLAETRQ